MSPNERFGADMRGLIIALMLFVGLVLLSEDLAFLRAPLLRFLTGLREDVDKLDTSPSALKFG